MTIDEAIREILDNWRQWEYASKREAATSQFDKDWDVAVNDTMTNYLREVLEQIEPNGEEATP